MRSAVRTPDARSLELSVHSGDGGGASGLPTAAFGPLRAGSAQWMSGRDGGMSCKGFLKKGGYTPRGPGCDGTTAAVSRAHAAAPRGSGSVMAGRDGGMSGKEFLKKTRIHTANAGL